jgi:hypothetical protein
MTSDRLSASFRGLVGSPKMGRVGLFSLEDQE